MLSVLGERDAHEIVALRQLGPQTLALTRRELWAACQSLSRALSEMQAERCLVVSRNPWHVLTAALATWTASAKRILALPPSLLPQVISELAEQTGAVVLSDGSVSTSRPGLRFSTAQTQRDAWTPNYGHESETAWAATSQQMLTQLYEQETIAAELYTSGTTGNAKACPKTLSQLLGEAALHARTEFGPSRLAETQPQTPSHARSVLSLVDPTHIFGLLFGVLVPFSAGVPFWFTEDQAERSALLASAGASDLVAAPAQLSALSRDPRFAERALQGAPRRVFCSGAPLDAQLGRELMGKGIEVVELFGSTETGGIARRRNDVDGAWQPLEGVRVDIDVDRLVVRSPFTLPANAPVTTNDRVRFFGNSFRHLGRADDVIKVGGRRVALRDIERQVLTLPHITDAAAVALRVPGLRNHEICLAVAAAEGRWSAQTLRQELLDFFEGAAVPRRIRILKELPRGANGKLPRAALLALFEASAGVNREP
ncbi:MAG TPA: class I adenylate-forming enzyme family protein [Polyangiaceae bacterium]|nr:class I adenylate-forming enzyme family protein [Polyangiaceae bacterium]